MQRWIAESCTCVDALVADGCPVHDPPLPENWKNAIAKAVQRAREEILEPLREYRSFLQSPPMEPPTYNKGFNSGINYAIELIEHRVRGEGKPCDHSGYAVYVGADGCICSNCSAPLHRQKPAKIARLETVPEGWSFRTYDIHKIGEAVNELIDAENAKRA